MENEADGVSIRRGVLRFIVAPSMWKWKREFNRDTDQHGGRNLLFPEPTETPAAPPTQSLGNGVWKITPNRSQEAIERAGYEMTYGRWAEVGRHFFTGKPMPKGWEEIAAEEAGYEATRRRRYDLPLRPLSARHERLAIVQGFGYLLEVDSQERPWRKLWRDANREVLSALISTRQPRRAMSRPNKKTVFTSSTFAFSFCRVRGAPIP